MKVNTISYEIKVAELCDKLGVEGAPYDIMFNETDGVLYIESKVDREV